MIAFILSSKFPLSTFSGMEVAVGILIFTLALLLFAIAYKKMLVYFGKKGKTQQKYCTLYSLEKQPSKDNIQFYFTSEEKKIVSLQILDEKYQLIKEIYNQMCRKDGNIIEFNTRELSNGTYFYCLQTENQKTIKKIIINN